MNYYIPKYFPPQEIFSSRTVADYTRNGTVSSAIWRLIDSRVVWTADQIRKRFGSMICNDYKYGGENGLRGYRPPVEIIDWEAYQKTGKVKTTFSTLSSQHCFGRALDLTPAKVTAEEIRRDIIANPQYYKFITGIEKEVNWLHFDVRNFNAKDGILIF